MEATYCFRAPYANDERSPSFLPNKEEGELLLAFLDAEFAAELQFQEALKASLITREMPSCASSAPPSTSLIATAGPSTEVSLYYVKEKGDSSLGSCGICLEKKEKDQMVNNESFANPICMDCSKTIELSEKEYYREELCSKVSVKNESQKLSGSSRVKTEHFNHDATSTIIGLNSAFSDGNSESSVTKPKDTQNPGSNSWGGSINTYQNLSRPCTADSEAYLNGHNGGSESNYTDIQSKPLDLVGCSSIEQLRNRQSIGSVVCKDSQGGEEKAGKDIKSSADLVYDDRGFDSLDDSDEFDSDRSGNSQEDSEKSTWLLNFLEELEKLKAEEIKDPARRWHCPACQDGPGATKWYVGLNALIAHAKNIRTKRVKTHRQLAKMLPEKSICKETSAISSVRVSSRQRGLEHEEKDFEIVWPPMVVIRNTALKRDENDKWIGITNRELLNFFGSYEAIVKVQNAYNWTGHCGISILIFESSAKGYFEAERLHKHFACQGTGRSAWDHRPVYFLPSGERQLYGYMALKGDVESFNELSKCKRKLKCEIRSYQEMVVNQVRQLSEDTHQLVWLKNRVEELQRHAKVLEESNGIMRERLSIGMKEIDIMRRKIMMQHEQHLEEMDFQEQFFKDQIKSVLEAREGKGEGKEVIENTADEDDIYEQQ